MLLAKRMKGFIARHRYVILLLLLSAIVYFPWLSWRIFTYSDWSFSFAESSTESLFLSTWLSATGMGQPDMFFWRLPFNFLFGGFGLLGQDSNIADKILVFGPLIFLPGITSFYLVRKIVGNSFAAFIGAIVYSFNSYFLAINSQGHVLLTIAFAIVLAAMYFFIEALEEKSIKKAMLTVFFLCVAGAYDLRVLYMAVLLFGLYGLYLAIVDRRLPVHIVLIVLVGIALLNAFWILPAIAGGSLLSDNILNRDLFGNNYWTLKDAITLHHPFWNGSKPEWFVVSQIPLYSWLIPLFAFSGLLVQRGNKKVIFFGLLAILGILLAKQIDAPFGSLYPWLFGNMPGFSAFREATKFYFFIVLSYAVLIAALFAWLLDRHNKQLWRKQCIYMFAALVAGLFLFHVKPLITGEVATLHAAREIPRDYKILKDFLLAQPEYFRTYWLPRDSRWAVFTRDHPKMSAIETAEGIWSDAHAKDSATDRRAGEDLVRFVQQDMARKLLDNSAVKYVVVPIRDTASDDDFFKFYGQKREFYVKELDKVDYLERIDIGTQELVVYKNNQYSPYIRTSESLIGTKNWSDAAHIYSFLKSGKDHADDFVLAPDLQYASRRIKALFTAEASVTGQKQELTVSDAQYVGSPKNLTLHKNLAIRNLQYTIFGNTITFVAAPLDDPYINKARIQFDGRQSPQVLSSVNVPSLDNTFLRLDKSVIPVGVSKMKQELGNLQDYKEVKVYHAGKDALHNGSFESGSWQDSVKDCDNYDARGMVGMRLNKQHSSEGTQSLQLEATRHTACTKAEIQAREGKYLLSLDYQSPNAKYAGYYVGFNNKSKTVISERLPIRSFGEWRTFNREIDVPKDATKMTLYLYAYESDRKSTNMVRYDNVRVRALNLVKALDLSLSADTYGAKDVSLEKGNHILAYTSNGHSGKNLIRNPSFEEGSWQGVVGDCNNHDNKGLLGMHLDKQQRTNGKQSLRLEATRHTACIKTDIALNGWGSHLFMFDYRGAAKGLAGYHIEFNDSNKTVVTDKVRIAQNNTWDTFSRRIAVPAGATNASLHIYAYESDGFTANEVRYDNFAFIRVPNLERGFFISENTSNTRMRTPHETLFTNTSPVKKLVKVNGASLPYVLSLAESFHPGWKLYLRPVNTAQHCGSVREAASGHRGGGAKITECADSSLSGNLGELGYLDQKADFDNKHFKLNGYSNGWIVDPAYIKANYSKAYYKENQDGSIDVNVVLYFKPQAYAYAGLAVGGVTSLAALSYLIHDYRTTKRRYYILHAKYAKIKSSNGRQSTV